jgi:hypothetical protein
MYKLFLVKPTTGLILRSNGEMFRKGEELDYRDTFESLDEALKQKDKLLCIVEWGVVVIYDETNEEEKFFSNEEIVDNYVAEADKLNCYLALPWYKKLFVTKPVLKYVKT